MTATPGPLRLEEFALDAWPALETLHYDGWLLRFSRGFTKRANSINALYGSSLPLDEKIRYCEAAYGQRGLPAVFRLTPFSEPPELDMALKARRYALLHPTAVMILELGKWRPSSSDLASTDQLAANDWLDLFCRVARVEPDEQRTRGEILTAIRAPTFRLAFSVDSQPAACGLGVLEARWLGLFDLVVDAENRRRGLGTRLLESMLHRGLEAGAEGAYLQVMEHNAAALGLYERAGFRRRYGYWYRVPPQMC